MGYLLPKYYKIILHVLLHCSSVETSILFAIGVTVASNYLYSTYPFIEVIHIIVFSSYPHTERWLCNAVLCIVYVDCPLVHIHVHVYFIVNPLHDTALIIIVPLEGSLLL